MGGKYYEELDVGMHFAHEPGRTITEADNLIFSMLTMNPQPLHVDAEYAKSTQFGQRIVNSLYTLGLVVGLSVGDTTVGTTIANLGFEETEFPNPVFIGGTIRVESEVLAKRESKSKGDRGIVPFEHRGVNQRGELGCRVKRLAMMIRKNNA